MPPEGHDKMAEALAQAAIAAGAGISDGGDLKVEVSVIGLLLAIHRSVSQLAADLSAGLATKADQKAIDALQVQLQAKGSQVDVDALGVHLRAIDTRTSALEAHKHVEEERAAAHLDHAERDRRKVMLAWKVAGALWGAIATTLLILATAGVFH